jgi:hypothetical protein
MRRNLRGMLERKSGGADLLFSAEETMIIAPETL